MKEKEKINKKTFKLSQEELESYNQFLRRGSVVKSKKGKGSYKRKQKYKENYHE